MKTLLAATALFLCLGSLSPAAEGDDAAKAFWKVLAAGDIEKLPAHYAEKVVLRAGSELLKKEWGLNESGERDKDKTVSRDDLMKAYSRLIEKVGKEKWAKVFGAVADDKITTKTLENKHVLLTVQTGPGEDRLEFELALEKDRWLVVAERTDY